jgi:hypothetical protein
MTTRLDDIKKPDAGADLTLGTAELGDKLVAVLQGLKVIDKAPVISNPIFGPRAGDQSWLDISGTARGILAGDSVTLHLRLFDGPKGERECLMRLESSGKLDDLVAGWLSSFDTDPWEVLTALEGVKWCVVFSSDFTADASLSAMPLPDGWPEDLPLGHVASGVLFSAQNVDYDADFVAEVGTKIGTSDLLLQSGTAVVRLAPPEPESKPRRDAVHMLRLRPMQDGTVSLPGFAAKLGGAEVLLPLEDDGLTGPRVCLPGELTIGAAEGQSKFEVNASFDLVSETVTARLTKPPTLGEMPGLTDRKLDATPPEFFDNLIKRATAEAWIVLNWSSDKENDPDRETVLAIGGAVGFDEEAPIELVPGRLTFAPSLMVEVEHPFTPEQRQLRGRMEGNLTLLDGGKPAFSLTGSVEIPGWYFTAKAEVPEVKTLMGALGLGDIQLPVNLQDASVSLALSGDVATKSFSAVLEFAEGKEWGGKLGGKAWALSKLVIGVDYDGETEELGFMVLAKLAFQTFSFDVSGGYEGGWVLRGGMEEGGTLSVSEAIKGLLEGLSFPSGMMPDDHDGLVLSDVAFAANFSAGEFSVRGRTAKPWTLIDGLTLNVEALEFEHSEGGTSATFAVRLTLGSVDILLEASTPKSTDAGWEFKGSTGQQIVIGDLIKVFDKNAKPPPALDTLTIENLEVSFHTASKAFTYKFAFTCEGKFKVNGTEVDCVVTIAIERPTNAEKPKIEFGGKVTVGTLTFEGKFWQEEKIQALIATYHPEPPATSEEINITTLVGKLPIGDAMPKLTIGLKDALFVYEKTFLFGVDLNIGATIDTSNWGVIGSLLGKQEIGLDDLRVLVASADFNTDQVTALNKLLLLQGIKPPLPVPSSEEAGKSDGEGATGSKAPIAISKGFNFSGNLKLGSLTPPPLMLPASGAGDTSRAAKPETPKKPPGEASTAKWIDIKKSLGPLYLGRVGFRYQDQKIGVLLDAAVDLAGLHVGLIGFQIRFPLSGSFNPSDDLGLDGLELAYANGPVQIAGSFLRFRQDGKPDQYDGMALIKATNFMITGFGSYTTVDNAPSMFIYAILHAELGGPPFFRVQGLAAGFGYNRKLTLPPIEEVQNFPLVRAALDEKFITKETPINEVLGKLRDYISPSSGDYWLAVGVRFNSFEMVQSFAMLSVSFGTQFQIAILGMSKITVPKQLPGAPPVDPVASAELAIKVSFTPATGLLAAEARLTDNSFLFTKDCRLTGGFAFYCWFAGDHEGDFVVTLGGYHAQFQKPAYYPVVPRLRIHWPVSAELSITGEAYFALTPSCVMAGGKLEAVFQSGPIRAWFYARADFLIAWKPFHYDIEAGVAIGVSFRTDIITLTVELAASVHMWGPPFGGIAHVTWYVISFDIPFGKQQPDQPAELTWEEFHHSFLPQSKEGGDPLVSTIRITAGLMSEREVGVGNEKRTLRVVNAYQFSFLTDSLIPSTELSLNAEKAKVEASKLGIRPMGKTTLDSKHKVSLTKRGDSQNEWGKYLDFEAVPKNVPFALWSKDPSPLKTPSAELIPKVPTGLHVSLRKRDPIHALDPIDLRNFQYDEFSNDIPWKEYPAPKEIAAPDKNTLMNTIWGNPTVAQTRTAILNVLGKAKEEIESIKLSDLAANAKRIFQAMPEMAELGEPLKIPKSTS